MAETKKVGEIQFTNVGNDDRIPYSKAHFFKACRVGTEFTVGAYQLDYQSIANALSEKRPIGNSAYIPVAKIVMDRTGLLALKKEIDTILELSPTPKSN